MVKVGVVVHDEKSNQQVASKATIVFSPYDRRYVFRRSLNFKQIVFDLKTMKVKYDEEDLGLILLCSLSSSYATSKILFCIVVTLLHWRKFLMVYFLRRK